MTEDIYTEQNEYGFMSDSKIQSLATLIANPKISDYRCTKDSGGGLRALVLYRNEITQTVSTDLSYTRIRARKVVGTVEGVDVSTLAQCLDNRKTALPYKIVYGWIGTDAAATGMKLFTDKCTGTVDCVAKTCTAYAQVDEKTASLSIADWNLPGPIPDLELVPGTDRITAAWSRPTTDFFAYYIRLDSASGLVDYGYLPNWSRDVTFYGLSKGTYAVSVMAMSKNNNIGPANVVTTEIKAAPCPCPTTIGLESSIRSVGTSVDGTGKSVGNSILGAGAIIAAGIIVSKYIKRP